jgi:hypothetical protein
LPSPQRHSLHPTIDIMKLSLGLLAAAAGCVAATSADVYMLPPPSSNSSPQISKIEARFILLQRLTSKGKGPSVTELYNDFDTEILASLLDKYGKPPAPLFSTAGGATPRQLVIMIEGLHDDQIADAGALIDSTFGMTPAFKIFDPPSQTAHDNLADVDFANYGIIADSECSWSELANTESEKCWGKDQVFKRVDAQTNLESLNNLWQQIDVLNAAAKDQKLETTILLLPSVAETSSTKTWAAQHMVVQRRQTEQVMTAFEDDDAPVAAPTSAPSDNSHALFYAATGAIPSCFTSESSCNDATRNCSGHGNCLDRYASSSGAESCFSCHCLSTENKTSGSITHWAGATCAKKDLSVQFWLFAGFTLLMLLIVTMSIKMLFDVGEEKLPGVIGAGVSRSK